MASEKIKIVMGGPCNVGKTSMLTSFATGWQKFFLFRLNTNLTKRYLGTSVENTKPTVGFDLQVINTVVDGKPVQVTHTGMVLEEFVTFF